jgi:hypothetical protein
MYSDAVTEKYQANFMGHLTFRIHLFYLKSGPWNYWLILNVFVWTKVGNTQLLFLIAIQTLDYFISCSPLANVNRLTSLPLFPVFTQDLMFIRCSRFLSHIFPPTAYRGHVLFSLLLGKERLIWTVAHVNASWNMCKHALVHDFAGVNTPRTCCGHFGN